jgi:hypothetical protein
MEYTLFVCPGVKPSVENNTSIINGISKLFSTIKIDFVETTVATSPDNFTGLRYHRTLSVYG